MYHIKPDKRSQRSATLICQGFNKCIAKNHNLNQITISQIIHEATIGRTTFYRLFDSKRDVLAYECDLLFKQAAIKSKSSNNSSTRDLFLYCAELCIKNHLLFEAIIKSHQAQIIYNTLMNRLSLIRKHFRIANNVSDAQMDYFLSDLTHLIISTLSTWIRHGEKESAQDLISNAAVIIGIIYRSIK